MELTQEYVRQLFNYDPDTGSLTWKVRKGPRAMIGDEAGYTTNNGYRNIIIDQKCYKAHRICWLWIFGTWPKDQLDHINNKKSDNRLCNIRAATNSQNLCNRGKTKNNRSGYKGVWFHKHVGKYTGKIGYKGKHIHLGYFDTPEQAAIAYDIVGRILHGRFFRGNGTLPNAIV